MRVKKKKTQQKKKQQPPSITTATVKLTAKPVNLREQTNLVWIIIPSFIQLLI